MLAVEKPKQPKVIKYVWWDGFNKKEVEEVFPTVQFSKFLVNDDDPWCVRIVYDGNRVRDNMDFIFVVRLVILIRIFLH